jgi:glycosyltransferase involved in cell wall biosynthesis
MVIARLRSARQERRILDAWSAHCCVNFRRLERLANALVRYASIQGRDILYNAAIPAPEQQNTVARLLREAGIFRHTRDSLVGQRLEPKAARTLARVFYRQQLLDTDLAESVQLYESLVREEESVLEPADHGYFIDGLTILGRRDAAAAMLERFGAGLNELDAYSYLLANVLNPHVGGSGSEKDWLTAVNSAVVRSGLEPVRLAPGNATPFRRLESSARQSITQGPLVSVLMPVYEADESTDSVIASILAQSWRNLELIIVDDASSDSAKQRLKRWEGADPRLHIVYNENNYGAYYARNTAFEMAGGEFVTVSDKDDWHHPQKLEMHVSDLAEQADKVANISSWSRVEENLTFLVRYAPLQMAHPSQPSLLFRREPVMSAIGYWDNVRKGADGEYKARIEKVFGQRIKPFSNVPLAFSLMGRENLTSRDFGLGYEHPCRSVYKHAYTHWHERYPEKSSLKIARSPKTRPFPAPPAFLPVMPDAVSVDAILAFDLSALNEESEAMRKEIHAALENGVEIAVMHLYDPFRLVPKHKAPVEWLGELILDEQIKRVSMLDDASAKIFVLATPRLLQFRPETQCRLSAQRGVIRADRAPGDAATGPYSARRVAANMRELFGCEACWQPVSQEIGLQLRRTLGRSYNASTEWRGLRNLLTTGYQDGS